MLSTKKIADAAISLGEVAHTAIVIFGDLAFSGNETEYIYVNRCVKHILEHYKAKSHNQSFIPIFSVPASRGNRGNVKRMRCAGR